MEIKKIKVNKGTVTKEIDAKLEKDYVKNGWVVVTGNPFTFNHNQYTPTKK